jgi:hypothetical protein
VTPGPARRPAPSYAAEPLFPLPVSTARGPHRVRVIGDLYHGRIPDGAVYVGRAAPGLTASPYANRHRAGTCRACRTEHDRAGAVAAHSRDLEARPQLVAAARRDLAGVNLACWCRLDARPCHADVLLLVVAGSPPLDAYEAVLADKTGADIRRR